MSETLKHKVMEKRPDSHKRTKSSLALSILHRDRSRHDLTEEDSSRAVDWSAGSPTGSPTSSHHGLGLDPQKYKSSTSNSTSATGATSELPISEGASISNVKAKDIGVTIEQSVRIFRLFEILRGGDASAIDRAVKDNTSKTRTTGVQNNNLQGTTILHLAIRCAETQVVEQILAMLTAQPDLELDLNSQDREGNTPLHLASMLGRATIVQSLLDQKGIDSSILNYKGRSPLDLARSPEIFQQLQYARAAFAEAQAHILQKLVQSNDYEGLANLLEDSRVAAVLDVNGADLSTDPSTTDTGGTLLHEAARKRDLQLIQLLLLHGADPFRRDRKGKLPQDVTKDDRTRAILKKSPAAAAAQRGIQEKAILGSSTAESSLGNKETREMKGYLKKWTNYTGGYKLRWFVLEDGVLSYYKNQDDAGSACRGAMNMRIAHLSMDAQDKSRFEIQGKSSVKYHLKANHMVEAKRWFWALNNAIQFSKDEAKDEEQRRRREAPASRQSGNQQNGRGRRDTEESDASSMTEGSKLGVKVPHPAAVIGTTSNNVSHLSLRGAAPGPGSVGEDESGSVYDSSEAGAGRDGFQPLVKAATSTIAGDLDDDEEYGDDTSSQDIKHAPKDAFNITAHSAEIQLDLLAQVSQALQEQISKQPNTPLSYPPISEAVSTYESAVQSLRNMIGDLLKIARDRDAYWQDRVDREVNMRRLWEDSMAKVAKEQEQLQDRMDESEEKRKRTKRALRDALEGGPETPNVLDVQTKTGYIDQPPSRSKDLTLGSEAYYAPRRKSVGVRDLRRKSTIALYTDLSDSDSNADEEFFDAVGAGEIEVVPTLPLSPSREPSVVTLAPTGEVGVWGSKALEIAPSFKGYEGPVRKKLKMDADDRPRISLWSILKSMIGKDMTKMTLPVSFNEPTSLLQRVAEDMEYTDLLDTAADRVDSSERMVYVAAFAASEYASTIGRVAKPFNPLLGETYEYVRPDKGYRFVVEQVSHHPPIGAAWAEAPRWDYYGESAVKSKFYGKSFDINPLGTWFLKLRPASGGEELYTWKKVTSSVIGIITGSPTVDNYGPMEIKNWTTGEICVLDFKARGWKASSAYQVSGKVFDANGKTRWSIGGRWNDKIYARLTPGFEGAVGEISQSQISEPGYSKAFLVWEAHQRPTGIPFNLTPFVVTLNALPDKLRPLLPPTDTRLRPDQRAMEDGEYDFAATEKNRVEEKQRAKRREREARGEEFVPHWFSKAKCEVTGEDHWAFNGAYWKTRNSVAQGGKWENMEDIF